MKRVLFFGFLLCAAPLAAGVVINEVAFDQPPGAPDWVELYNPGPAPASVDGWTLDDGDAAPGNEIVLHLSTPVPAGAFLLVYVDTDGAEDADFSDGTGSVYSGTGTTVSLVSTEDELALRAPSGLVDFLAWVTDGHYDGAADQADAVAAGLWTSSAAVSLADLGAGYSLARVADGVDADDVADFAPALLPTPGFSNVRPPGSGGAAPREVVINEVAWGGTAAAQTNEWIELLNDGTRTVVLDGWKLSTADGDVDVPLSGPLAPGAYYLLERTSDSPVSDVAADKIYGGSLSNSGEDLLLLDADAGTVDAARFSRSGWPAGGGAPEFRSMERVTPSADGDLWVNWKPNDGRTRNGADAKGNALNATPKARNAAYSPVLPVSLGAGNGVPADGALVVDPAANPFSPRDPDPSRRAARFIFDAGSPAAVKSIRVADVRGEVVRSFSDGDGLAGTAAGTVFWDGADAGGRLLPPGIYLVQFEAADPATGARRRGRGTVALGYPR